MIRKLKFKAWDTKEKLLKRLGRVELIKGELRLKNHIILQFTGHTDKLGQEIYEKDVLLSNGEERSIVVWSNEFNGWRLDINGAVEPFTKDIAQQRMRLCNLYEQS